MSVKNDFSNDRDKYHDLGYDYDKQVESVRDDWIQENKFQELLEYFIGNTTEHTLFSEPYLDVLLINKKERLFKVYWKYMLSEAMWYIWFLIDYYKNEKDKKFTTKDFLSYDRKILDANQDKYPAYQDAWLNFVWHWYNTLDVIDRFIVEMEKINATDEIERAKILKESVYNLKKPKAKKTTDKRKMNETLFWELIEQSREETPSDSEFLDVLKDKLEAMSAVEIKKFQKILLETTNELEHWDVWALACIVRGGCGDDGFDYFKAWIISKGKEAFESVKSMQIEKFQSLFKDDPQFEEFMYVAQEAYSNKKHDEMSTPRVKSQEIQGKKWDEKSICQTYPKLCEMFSYA